MTMRVLVTDGIMVKSLAVVRSIAGRVGEIGVVSDYPISLAGTSRHATRSHHIPLDPETYVRDLNDVIETYGYDHLVPVGGRTTELLAAHQDDVDVPVDRVLPSAESMSIAQDKLETYRLATRLDVPVPRTIRPDSLEDLEARFEFGFPAIVKTPTESAPRFISRVRSASELHDAYLTYRTDHGTAPLVQEHVPGEGCGFFALYLDGECAGSYSHRRIREYPPSGGASACAESHVDEEMDEYGRAILDELDWNGVAMVEFKRDAEGTPRLIEVNPKFWGSLDLAIHSGMTFPAALLDHASRGIEPDFSFEPSRVHWPLSGDLHHAVSRPATASEVIGDLLSPETRSNLSSDDPLPHLVELGKTILSPYLG
ncbi:MAG: ATP-grasp domain-containing protein [Halodesulfurarchaeum sp.]